MNFGLSDIVINELRDVFRKYGNIEKVLIFGSRSKGNFREGSDIDLAAVGTDITPQQLFEISLDIENLDLLYQVDLLNYNTHKDTPIGRHIDRVGQVFYSIN